MKTPAEHLVEIVKELQERVTGASKALKREQQSLADAEMLFKVAKEAHAQSLAAHQDAEGKLHAFLYALRSTDDPELLLAYLAKL